MRLFLSAVALFGAAVVVGVAAKAGWPGRGDHGLRPIHRPCPSFGFFEGGADRPAAILVPYNLRTPLFSDYAEKQRFIYLSAGMKISASSDGRLNFPVGTALDQKLRLSRCGRKHENHRDSPAFASCRRLGGASPMSGASRRQRCRLATRRHAATRHVRATWQ